MASEEAVASAAELVRSSEVESGNEMSLYKRYEASMDRVEETG